ncbi:DUF6036 family nucleotidyltransferase [Bhargavaea ginsengi]|uniref:DUF6036 family nucleotidyltransferase n=1 Tax=Bhargavaea ginsengi TaxID=426757 RepID=UPI00203EF541|nr:DUF6036 family nucleotidyltransferase [Bhargavaea ginsengi]MCM3087533.1 DUF6036 family nucleotidyltransferase [Bhargavaea ginsengi]
MENDNQFHTIEEIVDRLSLLDFYCMKSGTIADLVILGGSGILMQLAINKDEFFRSTQDIDVNILLTNDTEAIYHQLREANIDVVGGVMEVPPLEDFKETDSLYELDMDFSNIRVFVPTLELLACCKIFSKRQKDLDDLESTSLLEQCDKDSLLEMVDEYRANLLNEHDPDLNLHLLDNILAEKGI